MNNRGHIGYDDYREYLQLLLGRLRDHHSREQVLGCALFGSVARTEARADSDIDLLVVVARVAADTMPRFARLLHALEADPVVTRLHDRGLSPDPYPVFMTAGDLEARPLILLDILDHGIVLYDAGPLRDRMRRLRNRMDQLGTRKVTHADGSWHWDLKPDWVPGEVVERLLDEARLLGEELDRSCEGERWNLAVRRAQEIVELSLKGLLKAMCMEYPRLHDVGGAFAAAAATKGLGVDAATIDRIRQISSYLARDRAPAFYLEAEFSREQAGQAQLDARFVLDFAAGLAPRLLGPASPPGAAGAEDGEGPPEAA